MLLDARHVCARCRRRPGQGLWVCRSCGQSCCAHLSHYRSPVRQSLREGADVRGTALCVDCSGARR